MVTKTDMQAVYELQGKYVPAQQGILSDNETATIRGVLEIGTRSDIELQNIRDVTVMAYAQMVDAARKDGRNDDAFRFMDMASAICAAIDQEKCSRGMPV